MVVHEDMKGKHAFSSLEEGAPRRRLLVCVKIDDQLSGCFLLSPLTNERSAWYGAAEPGILLFLVLWFTYHDSSPFVQMVIWVYVRGTTILETRSGRSSPPPQSQ